ncbi:hypothetical protein B0J11DRAFT_519363, partial [Dendryphion nanum]
MIANNTRLVVTLDYGANQTEVPWLLDEFAYQWQTPFSPTDPSFPCTAQRPPDQNDEVSRDRMYVANHNLNLDIGFAFLNTEGNGAGILIPAYTELEWVNGVAGNRSLGEHVERCVGLWDRAPNWLLVDYYNRGRPFGGSVFAVAARANNVSYDRRQCCGKVVEGRRRMGGFSWGTACLVLVLVVGVLL